MVRSGDVVEAHQVCMLCACSSISNPFFCAKWDGAQFQWQKVGEVVDAVGSGRKQLHEGKEYDYVFDVDIQDGVPPLKLPYNAHGCYQFAPALALLIVSCRKPVPGCEEVFGGE
jgi:phospholipase A-2-activating protein